jgi:O-acetylhomoserine/O-acetylserine sulfhydrylase-like pyridoxal-dependent enzyme
MTEKRKLGLSTRAIHTPPLPAGAGEPVVGPIVASTTFAFEHAADLGAVLAEERYGFMYSRHRNPTVEELNAVLAELEGAEAAQAFGSGMGAISAALSATLSTGDTLLLAQQLYGTTYQLAESQLRPRGIEVVYLDVTDLAAWERPARVRYVETMANPGFPLADLAALAATKGDGLLIVDNTFASPALCRPRELGPPRDSPSATK